MTYFCPALDPPLDGSGRKTTTLVRDHEYFIHTKFHQNPSSGSGEEVENVNSLTDDGRRTDGRRTDAGQRMITIGHWSLWLLCPNKQHSMFIFSECQNARCSAILNSVHSRSVKRFIVKRPLDLTNVFKGLKLLTSYRA